MCPTAGGPSMGLAVAPTALLKNSLWARSLPAPGWNKFTRTRPVITASTIVTRYKSTVREPSRPSSRAPSMLATPWVMESRIMGAISILRSPMKSLPTFFIASAASGASRPSATARPKPIPSSAPIRICQFSDRLEDRPNKRNASANAVHARSSRPATNAAAEAASAAAIPIPAFGPGKAAAVYRRDEIHCRDGRTALPQAGRGAGGPRPAARRAAARGARGGARAARARVLGGRSVPPARLRAGRALPGEHRRLGESSRTTSTWTRCSSEWRAGGSSCSASR